MSNEKKKKIVNNLNIGSGNTLKRVGRNYTTIKKTPTPTLKNKKDKFTTSYNLLSAEEMCKRLPLSKILGKRRG